MLCGIVDLGSNTIRLSIYQWEEGQFRLLLNKKTIGRSGRLCTPRRPLRQRHPAWPAAPWRATGPLLDNFNVRDMRVFATASLRNIVNTAEAVQTIRDVTGVGVEVLSGEEEAALSFKGAVLPGGVPTGVLADIGGGSFELVAYEDMAITTACSLPVGSLSLYTHYAEDLFPTKAERRAMRAHVRELLDRAGAANIRSQYLCGVGGTIRALVKLCNDVCRRDPELRTLSAGELRDLYRFLKAGGKTSCGSSLRSAPDRVHTLFPGLIILNAIVKTCGVETVSASSAGVREGYLMDRVLKTGGVTGMSDHHTRDYSYTQERELSWLRFNERVMEEARDESVPLFERLKFAAIFTSNLDEFFMIRVGSLCDMNLVKHNHIDSKSGLTPAQQLAAVFHAAGPLYKQRDKLLHQLETRLRTCNICSLTLPELDVKERKQCERYFRDYVRPSSPPRWWTPFTPSPTCPARP